MQNSVQIFENEMLGSVRVKGDFENPLFCLSDVCRILEIQTPANIASAIKSEFELGVLNQYSFDTGYGIKDLTMITEPQLYFVLMRSDKPKAKLFRKWVIGEILPRIRKQGFYSPNEYISELMGLLTQNLPPYDFSVRIDVRDHNCKKEFGLIYNVGDAKFKHQSSLNTKFVKDEK